MKEAICSAFMSVSCGYMNDAEMYLLIDGSIDWFMRFNLKQVNIINWTPRDLALAAEYAAPCESYDVAERRMYRTLYQRGCIKPNYPVPAIPYHVDYSLARHGFMFIDAIKGDVNSQVFVCVSDEWQPHP